MNINDRMKRSLIIGKSANFEQTLRVLRADQIRLLEDYFDFDRSDLDVEAELMQDGVVLTLKLKARSFRNVGKVL